MISLKVSVVPADFAYLFGVSLAVGTLDWFTVPQLPFCPLTERE